MPVITLPNGDQRRFDRPVTVMEVAESIGPRLAAATLAGEIDGTLHDAAHAIHADAALRLVTARDPEGLEILRHSTAHLLAQAVKTLFPTAQVTIGPVIEDGFYYDFAYERPFTPEDLEAIEEKMKRLTAAGDPVTREVKSRAEAVRHFRSTGEEYKAQIVEAIPESEELSFYRQGDFLDLCRGPHVPNTKHLRAFKLTRLAGAYWRGDSANEMLQRIYGTAWPDQKALKTHLRRLEEAEKRDHRKLAKRLRLFHFQEEAPGMVFWHPRGWTLYKVVEEHVRQKTAAAGYQEINTPQLLDRALWEKSGHWDKFQENMFGVASDNRDYAIKPMNCPGHVQVFNQGRKSYRDLPLRLAEFGACHRYEPSGTLHGLLRARCFTQDDAHIFCAESQVQDEVADFIRLLFAVYADFGFDEVLIKLADRPPNRVGGDEDWDKAERALRQAVEANHLDWELNPGEGAFYGPKIEFSLRDCLGRVWQCGTMQVDFSMPARLGAVYVDERGDKRTPVMLHRAILGSLERFIGILIEHHAGAFPPWLAPTQAVVASISEKQADYAEKVAADLKKRGFRVEADLRNETIGLKIREHTLQRVPYLLILGRRERENDTVSARTREGEDLGAMRLADFAAGLERDIARRGRKRPENPEE